MTVDLNKITRSSAAITEPNEKGPHRNNAHYAHNGSPTQYSSLCEWNIFELISDWSNLHLIQT